MSNKFLIPVIIVLSLITIGVASLTQLNKAPEKVIMNTNQSSEVVSSVKTQVASSSSSALGQVSSSLTISSSQKAAESVKVESQTVVSNTPKCDIPESENLVRTEDGCFELIYGISDVPLFKTLNSDNEYINNQNKQLLDKDESNINVIRSIAVDYYGKISKKVLTKNATYHIGIDRKYDSGYSLGIFVNDTVYADKNPQIGIRQYSDRFNAKYDVIRLPNRDLNFKFQDFVRIPDGSIINETHNSQSVR